MSLHSTIRADGWPSVVHVARVMALGFGVKPLFQASCSQSCATCRGSEGRGSVRSSVGAVMARMLKEGLVTCEFEPHDEPRYDACGNPPPPDRDRPSAPRPGRRAP